MSTTARSNDFLCTNCRNPGGFTCKGCHLVIYCGQECQKQHWNQHKEACKSPLLKNTWQPQWVVETRTPTFIGDGPPVQHFGTKKYFWGNMPAFDVLQLQANEGDEWHNGLNLLFAASGDFRNVVKTVASIPENFTGTVGLYVNDKDLDIVARNLIIVLTALKGAEDSSTVDLLIHLWYSAFLRKCDIDFLASHVRPLIDDVVTKIKDRPAGNVFGKTWIFSTTTLRVELSKQAWMALPSYFQVRADLTTERAHKIRTDVTMAPTRQDYRDRDLIAQPLAHRLCLQRFRIDGVLLPFGYAREEFVIPNPTLYRSMEWPMMDSAEPLAGWDHREISKVCSGAADQDLYGKLFFHLRSLFNIFINQLAKRTLHFQLHHVDAKALPATLREKAFDRIEVSNISDGYYMGTARVLEIFKNMLHSPRENPRATLLALYLNAVEEVSSWGLSHDVRLPISERGRILQYLRPRNPTRFPYDTGIIMAMAAWPLVRDVDRVFETYMQDEKFDTMKATHGMSMKDDHSITDKWPLRLRLQPGQSGANEEFRSLLASPHSGTERYVEWKRDT